MSWQTPKRKPRTKAERIEYLCDHPRYSTMNSRNQSTSFSRCIKLQYINFPNKEAEETAWELIGMDHFMARSGFSRPLDAWQRSYGHRWQWGTNGRSGGYVVVYHGDTELDKHPSYCEHCGQQNFTKILDPEPPEAFFEALTWCCQLSCCPSALFQLLPDRGAWPPAGKYELVWPVITRLRAAGFSDDAIKRMLRDIQGRIRDGHIPRGSLDNRCGRCGEDARVNYDKPPVLVKCWPGRDVYQDDVACRFEGFTADDIAPIFDMVWSFDKAVDDAIAEFVSFCQCHAVDEEEILVPHTRKVLVGRESA